MDNTLTVTTLNILNNPELKEERVEVLFKELNEHQPDIVLLQEVLVETFPLIYDKAAQDGWTIVEGSRVEFNPNKISGNVTLSRLPIESMMSFPCFSCEGKSHIKPLITHHENNITSINVHLPWGNASEAYRLDTAYRLNQYVEFLKDEEPDRLVVMGGDLNATPNSATLRYLGGDLPYRRTSTYWTNAWSFADTSFSTARKDGGWAENTAKSVGIARPDHMPNRTIDHVLTYGWNYGKKHAPLELKRFGESTLSNGYGLSDHYGITAKIAL